MRLPASPRAVLARVLVLAWLVAGCGARRPEGPAERHAPALRSSAPRSSEPPPPEAEPSLVAEARLSDGALDVSLEIPLAWIGRPVADVRLVFAEDLPFEQGPPGFSRFLTALAPGGGEGPFTGEYRAEAGRIVARYRVRLAHHLAKPLRGLDEVPHPTSGGWALAGRAFLPVAIRLGDGKSLDLPGRLALRGPAGAAHVGSPAREGDGYVASSFTELASALYFVGRFRTTERREGDGSIRIVTSDFDEGALGRFDALVSRALSEGRRRLGDPPPGDRLILVDRNPAGIDGGVVGRAIAVLSEVPPDGRARSDAGVVAVHELVHLWNRADVPWLGEGLTRYFEIHFKASLDGASRDAAMADVLETYERYLDAAAGRTVEASSGAFAYAAGAVLAYCIDVHLRERGSDLFAIHRAARTASAASLDPTADTLTPVAFLEALDAASSETGRFARELLARPGPVDLRPCLRGAGYDLSESTYRGYAPGALSALLGIRTRARYTAEVFSALEGGPLLAGDVIRVVGGREVASFRDVEFALRDAPAGGRVELEVSRAGERRRVRLEVPRLPPSDRPTRRRRVARPVPGAKGQACPFRELDAPLPSGGA